MPRPPVPKTQPSISYLFGALLKKYPRKVQELDLRFLERATLTAHLQHHPKSIPQTPGGLFTTILSNHSKIQVYLCCTSASCLVLCEEKGGQAEAAMVQGSSQPPGSTSRRLPGLEKAEEKGKRGSRWAGTPGRLDWS